MKTKHPFINIVEIIFAFFMTANLYGIINNSGLEECKFLDFFKFVLCALILIRFFFAPTSNIEVMLFHTGENLRRKLYIFGDFLLLIIQAVFFYFICNSFFPNLGKKYWFYLNQDGYAPFIWVSALLMLNSLWLTTIQGRIYVYEKRLIWRYCVWISNNVIIGCSLLISFIVFKHKIWMLILAYFNCLVDIYLTAPDYLMQRKPGIVKEIFGLELWGHALNKTK